MTKFMTITMTTDQVCDMAGHLAAEQDRISQIVSHFAKAGDQKQHTFWAGELDKLNEIMDIIDDAIETW